MIRKFNTWYDGIQEPWKFMLLLSLTMPCLIFLASGYAPLIIAGWLYGLSLIGVRIIGRYK
jgi:hypothetical protein